MPQTPTPTDNPKRIVELRLPAATILKVLATLVVLWALLQLRIELFLIVVSVLLAIAVYPVVAWVERRGLRREAGIALVGLVMLALALFGALVVVPPLMEEIQAFSQNLPEIKRRIDQQIGPSYPFLAKVLTQVLALPTSPGVADFFKQPLVWGKIAVGAVTSILLVMILTLYFLVDGKRLYAWILAYVPRKYRKRMSETVPEVSEVVRAYVQGQLLTSFLAAAVSFAILTSLHVPAALPLALLAGLGDVVPVLGMVVSTVPAVLLALTVSPQAALFVLVSYLAFNALETYVILPRVYGNRLRLSTLAVLLALIAGGSLGGIVGAILVLPFVAAYPIVERIWLYEYLGRDVVADHAALQEAAGEEHEDAVLNKVLEGSKHGQTGQIGAVPKESEIPRG